MLNRASTPSSDSFFLGGGQMSSVVVNSCEQFSQPHCAPSLDTVLSATQLLLLCCIGSLACPCEVKCSSFCIPFLCAPLLTSQPLSDTRLPVVTLVLIFLFQLRLCVTYLIAMMRIFDQKNLRKKAFILAGSGFTVRCGGGSV